jgi:pyruvate/2-oxoglutarate dehydrogenase complex dihydrolipoamide dehydrogenase (E3) component
MKRFDAIVVGAGQAGPPLVGRLTAAGMKVAIVERKWFGGTCVNDGCTPTKTLIASARVAHLLHRVADYGVNVSGRVEVDFARVKARADAVVRTFRSGIETNLRDMDRCTVVQGHAKFDSPTAIRVGGELLVSERIFINTGGRAFVPPMPGVESISFLTNTSILALESLPHHLVVVGGSYVGLEFAQMFRRFGSEVTVVEKMSRLAAREDPDVSEAIRGILEKEGIAIRVEAECISFSPSERGVVVHLECESGDKDVEGTHALLAVGRRPNTDDLELEHAGVAVDARGYIVVDDQLRTTTKGIWALGDCNGRGAFTHTSYNDFEIVAANLLDGDRRSVRDRIPCYALYTDPPLGRAGITELAARSTGRPFLVATRSMSRVARAYERDETQGFMKIVVDAATKKILGAALLGIEGDEVIHGILDTMYAGAPYTMLQRTMGIHPTVSELIPTMLRDLRPGT